VTGEQGRRRLSLRTRITAGALVLVLAAVGAVGVAVIKVLEREMVEELDASLTSTAEFMDRVLRAGEGLPTSEGPADLYVQFLDGDGVVLGASDAAIGVGALAESLTAGATATAADPRIRSATDADLGALRVLTMASPTDSGVTIVIARSSAHVGEVRDTLQRLLAVAIAALTIFLGCLIWWVVGRALRPVDTMARKVQRLGREDLRARVSRPGTGDELDRLADVLNDLLGRLDQARDREQQFVSDASHELRTPIAGLRALIETEPTDPVDAAIARDEALARIGALQDLVDGLLALSRADETGEVADGRPVDLDELVLGHAAQLRRRTDLDVDIRGVSGGQVVGRESDLDRLIENLVANASRYASTSIVMTVQTRGDEVEMTVTDDGPGIAEADRTRVFERFTTIDADPALAAGDGVGLGLAIAAAITAAHHGTIRADAAPGGGARFTVLLPSASPSTAGGPAERTFSDQPGAVPS
jgi:signal transduction histidine kinase